MGHARDEHGNEHAHPDLERVQQSLPLLLRGERAIPARALSAATAEQSFWVIDAARDRAGAAQVIRSITAFSEEVTDDGGGLGVAGVVLFDRVDEGLLELVSELCGGGRRVLGVALAGGALSGDPAWRLLGAGLSDVAAWDGCADGVRLRLERWALVDRLAESALVAEHLIGCSAVWRELVRDVVEVGFFSDVNVLLCGESGTGKELAGQLIHSLDQRPGKAELVVVDCTTIVPSLSGSELFGHERGAFTGAVAERDGAFALADGGTLFLDEVGELPLALQAELLRVVQEGAYKRVGSNRWQRHAVPAGVRDQPRSARRSARRGAFATTCSSAWRRRRSGCPRCESVRRTFCAWPSTS